MVQSSRPRDGRNASDAGGCSSAGVAAGDAHGKLILLGEHAVVYDVPALVAGLGLGLRATARRHVAGGPCLLVGTERVMAGAALPLGRALAALLEVTGAPAGLELVLDGALPAGVGLGHSAAAGVASARALLALQGRDEAATVRAAAMAWERVFHGNPSGVDVVAAMEGGLLRFTRSGGATRLASGRALRFCVGLTGQRSPTHEMVERVAALRARAPMDFARAIDGIAALVADAEAALGRGEVERLGALMSANQRLLGTLGVSSAAIDALVAMALDAGALGAKLTGAGGGGAVVALLPTDDSDGVGQRVMAGWDRSGFQAMAIDVAAGAMGGAEAGV